jgi:hypothetical protein
MNFVTVEGLDECLLLAVDSTGERNTLRHMEECSHEAETSDLLLGQPESTDVASAGRGRPVASMLGSRPLMQDGGKP